MITLSRLAEGVKTNHSNRLKFRLKRGQIKSNYCIQQGYDSVPEGMRTKEQLSYTCRADVQRRLTASQMYADGGPMIF